MFRFILRSINILEIAECSKHDLELSESNKLAASKDQKTTSLQKSAQNKRFSMLSGTKIGEELLHFLVLYKFRY